MRCAMPVVRRTPPPLPEVKWVLSNSKGANKYIPMVFLSDETEQFLDNSKSAAMAMLNISEGRFDAEIGVDSLDCEVLGDDATEAEWNNSYFGQCKFTYCGTVKILEAAGTVSAEFKSNAKKHKMKAVAFGMILALHACYKLENTGIPAWSEKAIRANAQHFAPEAFAKAMACHPLLEDEEQPDEELPDEEQPDELAKAVACHPLLKMAEQEELPDAEPPAAELPATPAAVMKSHLQRWRWRCSDEEPPAAKRPRLTLRPPTPKLSCSVRGPRLTLRPPTSKAAAPKAAAPKAATPKAPQPPSMPPSEVQVLRAELEEAQKQAGLRAAVASEELNEAKKQAEDSGKRAEQALEMCARMQRAKDKQESAERAGASIDTWQATMFPGGAGAMGALDLGAAVASASSSSALQLPAPALHPQMHLLKQMQQVQQMQRMPSQMHLLQQMQQIQHMQQMQQMQQGFPMQQVPEVPLQLFLRPQTQMRQMRPMMRPRLMLRPATPKAAEAEQEELLGSDEQEWFPM